MKFSSALVLSAVAATALAESITTTITATKAGHVYTKTITQDATYVWGGEGSSAATTSAAAETTSAAAETTSAAAETTSAAAETTSAVVTSAVETTSAAATSSADEGSGSSITTVITATKNGHVYTKTVTQDATYVWTGEGSSNTWSPSTSATSESASSSASTTPTSTVETSTSSASSSTAQVASYTGAADAITAGTGLMGAALAAVILL